MSRRTKLCARAVSMAVFATAATTAHAADLYWQGGPTNTLESANYSTPSPLTANVAPTSADSAYIGADSTATHSTGDLSLGRLIIGHNGNNTASAPGLFAGDGTVEITGGTVSTTLGSTTAQTGYTTRPNAGLIIGMSDNGSLSITNATVTSNNAVIVGASLTDSTILANLNVNTGGTLKLTAGGLSLGGNGTSTVAGAGGNVTNAGGTITVSAAGADLVIGTWNKSSFTQTSGTTTIADEVFVGRRNADFTTFTMSGGSLTSGNFNVADTSGNGTIDDVTVSITNSNLNITGLIGLGENSARRANMTIGQGAIVSATGAINVAGASTSSGTTNTLNITGTGKLTGGAVTVGNGTAATSTLTISGSSTANVSSGAVGIGASNNSSLTVNGSSSLSITGALTLGGGGASNYADTPNNAKFNVGDSAHVTIGGNLFLGRSFSTNTTFTQSGGTLDINGLFLTGTSTAQTAAGTLTGLISTPTGIVGNHSAGSLTVHLNPTNSNTGNFILCDSGGPGTTATPSVTTTVTYNLSGTGSVVAENLTLIGRQKGTAILNQTGGSFSGANGIHIGDARTATTSTWATGTYTISAGSVTASTLAPATENALDVARNGTGTLRVVGSDPTITVNGNMLVNATAGSGVGTLAYRLKSGNTSLSTIVVNPNGVALGNATFNAGAVLALEFNGLKPVQGVYNVLTANDIINNNLTPSIPAGWNFQIVPGATSGKVLRFIAGDLNADAAVTADDFALMDRGAAMGLTGGANGDLNADGSINAEDYMLIDSAYGTTHTLSPEFLAAREAQFGGDYVTALTAAVPEPSLLSIAAAALVAPLARRRRRA